MISRILIKILVIQLFNIFVTISSSSPRVLDNLTIRKDPKRLKKEEGALRLVGGSNHYEGNVEVLHDGKWGSICDDEWDENDARVACRQMGFDHFVRATHSSYYGRAKRKFWMDNIFCDGTEQELANCRFEGTWGQNDCRSDEAAGVQCEMEHILPKQNLTRRKLRLKLKDLMQVRLQNGRIPTEGRVEVRFGSGAWGSICGDGFSLLEANVICKELGLGYASSALQTDAFGSSNSTNVLISGVECIGNETSLANCQHFDIGHKVACSASTNIAAVICTTHMADLVFDVRELEKTLHLEDRQLFYLQCAMEENCLASDAYEIQTEYPDWYRVTRRLLKFTARTLNNGTADFRSHIPKHLWEWHSCHMHYHSMEVFANFDIINHAGEKIAEGHKASFCLEDNHCLPGVKQKYFCANYGDQGISVGCYDVYRYNIDCQWIDITEIDFGTYIMKVSINPEFKVAEMRYDNNAAICTLIYAPTFAKVFNCRLERP